MRKTTYSFLLLLVLGVGAVKAASSSPFEQRLAWNPSPTTNVSSYVLYISTNLPTGTLTNWQRVAVTNYYWGTNLLLSITNGWFKTNFVAGVTNWLTLTAQDTSGVESEPSNIILYIPPKPPTILRLFLQTAPSINGPWQTWTNSPPFEIQTTEPMLFSRLLHET